MDLPALDSPMKYLDRALSSLREMGLVPDKATAEAPIVPLLNEITGLDEDKVVVMAVADDRGLEDPLCPGKTYNEPFLAHQFAMRFEHGLLGSLCASNYGPYFEDAATLAAELCELGPQG